MVEDQGVTHWNTRRPFWWGLLHILDRDASDVPELTDAAVSQSRDGLAVKVLHAQDVDLSRYGPEEIVPPAQVQVEIRIGEGASGEATFDGSIEVPSGVLTVGDAEQEEALTIGAGRWAVQVTCEPTEHAELVRVWLRPE